MCVVLLPESLAFSPKTHTISVAAGGGGGGGSWGALLPPARTSMIGVYEIQRNIEKYCRCAWYW